jgi:hypothetical protein
MIFACALRFWIWVGSLGIGPQLEGFFGKDRILRRGLEFGDGYFHNFVPD